MSASNGCKKKCAVSNELNELASSQYAPFSHKIALLFSFFGGGATPKKWEHSRERTWTADAPSTDFVRILGCANARKYDYKSSSLPEHRRRFFGGGATRKRRFLGGGATTRQLRFSGGAVTTTTIRKPTAPPKNSAVARAGIPGFAWLSSKNKPQKNFALTREKQKKTPKRAQKHP